MKKITLLFTAVLLFSALPLFAQTSQITLQVYRISKFLGSDYPMYVYVDGSLVFNLMNGESKEIKLSGGNHTLYITHSDRWRSNTVTFNENTGRVVFNATLMLGWNNNTIELARAAQPQSVAQQPQGGGSQVQSNNTQSTAPAKAQSTTQNVEKLTYYVNGRSKTANVVFYEMEQNRFYLDNGGNVLRSVRDQKAGGTWGNWENQGIVIRGQGLNIYNTSGIYGALMASIDFNNAIEEKSGGNLYIVIYQKYNDGSFMQRDDDYVYTTLKTYREVR